MIFSSYLSKVTKKINGGSELFETISLRFSHLLTVHLHVLVFTLYGLIEFYKNKEYFFLVVPVGFQAVENAIAWDIKVCCLIVLPKQ